MFRNKLLFFLVIILLASFLRLWQLGNVPPSPDWDEAALGYNAYSLMRTGRDEYGKFLPIVLRSFDDYKPALYAYLTIPSIAVFGLNTFAVRLPSAVMGILTVIAVYFLVKELFGDYGGLRSPDGNFLRYKTSRGLALLVSFLKNLSGSPAALALMSAFFLAISPWHLQFSRIAFESNVGLAFNVFSALFFLKGLKNPWLLSLSAIFASLSLYTYQSEKIFTPLLLIALVLIYRQELWMLGKKYLVLAFITGMILSLPLVNYTLTDAQALTRARGVSVFADQTSFLQKTSQRLLVDQKDNDKLGILLDNRRLQYGSAVISGYLSHFSFNWLFLSGDEARHHAPGMGLLYFWELPFLLFGLYVLIFGDYSQKSKYLIFTWFLLAPLPASMTSGVPHSVRTLNFLPTFQIFTAVGIISSWNYIMSFPFFCHSRSNRESRPLSGRWIPAFAGMTIKYWITKIIIFVAFFFFLFNFFYYLNQYFVQQNYYNSQSWQYGYQQIVSEVKKRENQYDKIIISNQPYMDQSYMFFLYYLKYDPLLYQKESQKSSGGFRENHFFGKFEFRPIDWAKEKSTIQTLFIGRISDFPSDLPFLKKIYFLDGQPDMEMVERL